MIKFFTYLFQSIFIYIFLIFGRILGLKNSQNLFSKMFQLLGPVFRSDLIINENLNRFNPNLTRSEKKLIISQMWSNYGKTFIEYVFLDKFKRSTAHVRIKNKNILDAVITNNKPVIFISGHFANFELMSMEMTKNDIKLATIYRPLNNYFLNPFMEFLRRRYICKNQIKKGINGVREAIEYIKKGFSIALMIDQRVSEGEKINLFNKLALTTTLPAQLSLKYNLPIIPVFIERTKENNFEITFHEEIKPNEFKSKIDLTAKLNRILEQMIKKNPYQWIWTHNRWK